MTEQTTSTAADDVDRLDWLTPEQRDLVARVLTNEEFVLMMNATHDHAPRGGERICAEDGVSMWDEDGEEAELLADAHKLQVLAGWLAARPRYAVGDVVSVPVPVWAPKYAVGPRPDRAAAEVTDVRRRAHGEFEVCYRYLAGGPLTCENEWSMSEKLIQPAEIAH